MSVDVPLDTRLLVVDDVEANRYILSSWLRRAGFEVSEASTGRDALAIMQNAHVDLVVLDVNLPDMSGPEVCERIKADEATAEVPVMHVSATATAPSDRSTGLRRGADAYLVEPIDREEFLASVMALLRYSEARRRSEHLARLLSHLHRATLSINAALSFETLATTVALAAATLVKRSAVVVVVPPGEAPVRVRCTVDADGQGMSPSVERLTRFETDGDPAASALEVLRTPDAAVVPLLSRDNVPLGALATDGGFADPSDGMVWDQLVQAASLALDNLSNYDVDHRIAVTLQQSLLPVMPDPEGFDVAARYVAGAEHAEVGGDFYEVIELENSCIAVAIGDVQGHSLQAAVVMSELRNALRAYLLDEHLPHEVLTRLNRLLRRFHPESIATVWCGVFDSAAERVRYANAGHLPPVVKSGGVTSFLARGDAVLGVEQEFELFADAFPRGALAAFVTDGLVERRQESLSVGLNRLADAVAQGPDEVEALSTSLLERVGPGPDPFDDVAVVALRHRT